MQNPRHNAYICSRTNYFSMDTILLSFQERRQRTVAFTGHRSYCGEADGELRAVLSDLVGQGFTRFLCGMAWGFDLAAGAIVKEIQMEYPHIELVAVEPFADFRKLFSGEDGELYDALVAQASERVVVSDEAGAVAYMRRNDYLVDNSSLIIAWCDGRGRGGTTYTVSRARKSRVEVINLYPEAQLEFKF